MEFVEEIDIKEEVDLDGDLEGQDEDMIPNSHDWKLDHDVDCRVAHAQDFPPEHQLHAFVKKSTVTVSKNTMKLATDKCIDPDTRVQHVDLDLSDMFLIEKTMKVEPGDVEKNSDDPLALCDLKDCVTETGNEPEISQPSNPILNNPHNVPVIKMIYKCDMCEKDFTDNSRLNRHKLTHSGEKLHRCDVCGKHFALNSRLTRHKLIHSGEKPHRCEVCGMHFVLNSLLAQHRVIHSGEKPHRCDICGMGFARKSHLIRHKFTHTGEKQKPYRCDVCGYEFSRNSQLTSHKLTIHCGKTTQL